VIKLAWFSHYIHQTHKENFLNIQTQTNKQSTVMKNLLNIALLILAVFIVELVEGKNTCHQQDTSDAEVMTFGATKKEKAATGAFGEMVATSKSADAFFDLADKKSEETPEFVRQAKLQNADYTGYTIELMTVYNKPLSISDELFQNFGGIRYVQKTANSYTYYLGDFQDKDAMTKYLEQIVKPRYTNATAVKFKNGEEIKK
jgi:hypothetical protein